MVHKITLLCALLIWISIPLLGQKTLKEITLYPDSLNRDRLFTASALTGVSYTAFSVGLYHAWYKNFDRGPFRLFNDWNEWNNMDKAGHFYGTYTQSALGYQLARWTGLNETPALITGITLATLFQTTVEVMDGYSEKWGFSVHDIVFNTAGALAFAGQQWGWKEQRILFKFSAHLRNYSAQPIPFLNSNADISLKERSDDLFGKSAAERILKDYNGQTYWVSMNIASFLPQESRFPRWLNFAVGVGSENLFGGFDNTWNAGEHIVIMDASTYPRYVQFYISPDVDWSRIKTSNPYVKTILNTLNMLKVPAPTLEINTLGQLTFHFIYF